MNAHELPTWNVMVLNTRESLDTARNAATDARDWIMSDWQPVGSTLTNEAAEARTEILKIVHEIKALVDQGKDALRRAQNGT
ncbi:hypothetical protein [Actinocrispum wychmicini]|uniref:Uncharacterized protein n=1 Tax=Actinocrispum wychmicini TaxID=1213861 RepID=A0A4R2JQJ8_9PSEU|nr:hypothetical protein [Actinocrispum wychmicini]TCO61082.1 hypothetical protein EV192_103666 [Actinocrispum wychmicini]